jgi:dienelactone hydrolase
VVGVAFVALAGHDGSAGWQLARVVGVGLVTTGVIVVLLRTGARGRGWVAAGAGIVALAVGAGFIPYVVKQAAPSVEAVCGMTALVGGGVLAAWGVVIGSRGRRVVTRTGTGLATFLAAVLVTFVVAPAIAATNVPRPYLGATPASRGLAYTSVTLVTGDGTRLAGWYVPSTNRAAVLLLHGAGSTRSDVLDEAAVLAGHGFGVLMVDARGHGASEGRAMDFGWHGDADVAAATRYLAGRADVDGRRIGAVGLSMGGEEVLGASATNGVIRAVVAEGAVARNAADEAWLSDTFGLRGWLQVRLEQVQDWVTDALTSAPRPTPLRRAVEASGDTRYLLIAAGEVADETRAAEYVAAGAPDRVRVWTVPGAAHTGGLAARPAEWEQRVVTFLSDALGRGDAA